MCGMEVFQCADIVLLPFCLMLLKEEAFIGILALGLVDADVGITQSCERSDVPCDDVLHAVKDLELRFLVVVLDKAPLIAPAPR